ncbi:MAG: MarC family protein [Proteobacteria bacterium]|nr:MarC family protein [Pseudomonadota bacterium]MBU1449387.1 MarC family protein [Pseudomonadota bacterium]MBU2467945.1 MarC family protein [Pseudomonadota bacterium]MBU2518301.1 MarC family protein [Pseudomonadota bacterium]
MDSFPLIFMSFFAMTNPIGNLPIFIGLTSGRPAKEVRRIGLITTVSVLIICVISMTLGEWVLKAFGITLPAFRTAGGLVITLIGLRMLLVSRVDKDHGTHDNSPERSTSVGVVPMAIPIMAGPGLISTVVLHSHGALDSPDVMLVVGAAVLALTLVVGLVLYGAPWIARLLGGDGMVVLTKVMGLFLTAMGIQFIFIGLKNCFVV